MYFQSIKLNSIMKSEIWDLEEKFFRIALDTIEQYEQAFAKYACKIEIVISRWNNHKFEDIMRPVIMSKEQCLELGYQSALSTSVETQSGELVGNEEDGYLFDNISIWHVDRCFFFCKRGFMNKASERDIQKELSETLDHYLYLLEHLRITEKN